MGYGSIIIVVMQPEQIAAATFQRCSVNGLQNSMWKQLKSAEEAGQDVLVTKTLALNQDKTR